MTDRPADDWTPRERARLDALPRERRPPASLKQRIGDDLRGRGLLGRAPHRMEPGGRALRWTGRIAAAVALFLAGAWFGRTGGGGDAGGVVLVADPLLAPAERVQRTGSQYVESVARFALDVDSLPEVSALQGREAALNALRGAAEHVARIPGHSPRTRRALLELRSAGSE